MGHGTSIGFEFDDKLALLCNLMLPTGAPDAADLILKLDNVIL
jgi:hypothetical protein